MQRVRRAIRLAPPLLVLGLLASGAAGLPSGSGAAPAGLKTERFDRDPGWEGYNNRLAPPARPATTQDFGYSRTHFAGAAPGEIGGRVTRSSRPTYYAARIRPRTLEDPLAASGAFALTASSGSSGVFFGWFRSEQGEGSGRPMHSLGMELDGEEAGARLLVRLVGGTNRTCGSWVTPFVPGKFRPTPIRPDGTRYRWSLRYDPRAGAHGQIRFTIRSDREPHEPWEGREFVVDLPEEIRRDGATFDRFGLMNNLKPGHSLTIYFDDLRFDGRTEEFRNDPGWIGSGNRETYPEPAPLLAHDFGYSAGTRFAGGEPGEAGGIFWRTEKPWGYYADRIGPLGLDRRLEARGRVILLVGAPDSDMHFGWFSTTRGEESPERAGPFLGVHVGGPSRVGHYFQPVYTLAPGRGGRAEPAPVLTPGRVFEWSLVYDPAAAGGVGALRVTLGRDTATLPLRPGERGQGVRFDRFGFATSRPGGQMLRIYFDDLTYTAGADRNEQALAFTH